MTPPPLRSSRFRPLLRLVLLLVLVGIGLGFYSTDWGRAFGSAPAGESLLRMQRSKFYAGDRFSNSVPTAMLTGSNWSMLYRWLFESNEREPLYPLTISEVDASLFAKSPDSRLRLTWLGHSSVLIEIDGQRVLTDPVFSERISPSTWIGPKRFFLPPLAVVQMPTLDAVVISHDHYDHLDQKSIQALEPVTQKFFVPLGVAAHLKGWGVEAAKLVELDWWESAIHAGLEFTATPARHFSGRALTDRDHTLWASWAIIGDKHRVFFTGDTGYFAAFKDIGERLGPFNVSLVEAGAYDRLWPHIHLGPEGALKTHRDLGAGVLLPVHWGTFNLAMHAWTEPIERLAKLAEENKVKLAQPEPGQSFEPYKELPNSRWWNQGQ